MSVHLTGWLRCRDDSEAAVVRDHLVAHVTLTRAERGCVAFDVRPTADPLVWQVDEAFADRASFEAHQERGRLQCVGHRDGRDRAGVQRR